MKCYLFSLPPKSLTPPQKFVHIKSHILHYPAEMLTFFYFSIFFESVFSIFFPVLFFVFFYFFVFIDNKDDPTFLTSYPPLTLPPRGTNKNSWCTVATDAMSWFGRLQDAQHFEEHLLVLVGVAVVVPHERRREPLREPKRPSGVPQTDQKKWTLTPTYFNVWTCCFYFIFSRTIRTQKFTLFGILSTLFYFWIIIISLKNMGMLKRRD